MPRPSTIAIDGPAASGKSTIGGLLSERLGYLYLDTGAMYRAVTWAALQKGLDVSDEEAISALARTLNIEIARPVGNDGRQYTVLADGEDVTWQIRDPEVDRHVSPVSAYAGVRKALTEQQRRVARQGSVVMVGRDIGTVVIPDADLKIYVDASPEVRARRRYLEILERGEEAEYESILHDMRRRDGIDSQRQVAPLRAAEDAVRVDTDNLSIAEVLRVVEELVDGWVPDVTRDTGT
ncbi:MAG: (d)CMP kinase [Anaerolineae bacterium]